MTDFRNQLTQGESQPCHITRCVTLDRPVYLEPQVLPLKKEANPPCLAVLVNLGADVSTVTGSLL